MYSVFLPPRRHAKRDGGEKAVSWWSYSMTWNRKEDDNNNEVERRVASTRHSVCHS